MAVAVTGEAPWGFRPFDMATGVGTAAVTYFAADITFASPTGLRSAFAKDTFGQHVLEVRHTWPRY